MAVEIFKKLLPNSMILPEKQAKTVLCPAIWFTSPTSTGGGRISLISRTVKKVGKNTTSLHSLCSSCPLPYTEEAEYRVLVPNYDILVLEGVSLELQLLLQHPPPLPPPYQPNNSDTLTYLSWRVLVLSSNSWARASSSCSSPSCSSASLST
jgi:hypothetical protein